MEREQMENEKRYYFLLKLLADLKKKGLLKDDECKSIIDKFKAENHVIIGDLLSENDLI